MSYLSEHKYVRRTVWVAVAILSASVLLTMLTLTTILWGVRDRFDSVISTMEIPVNPSHLDAGVQVERANLEAYLRFSVGLKSIDHALEKYEQEAIVLEDKGKYQVLENIELPEFIENQCDRYLCLQHKVGFGQIPAALWQGLMGVEDYRFLDHFGIDYISILRAIVADIKAMSLVQGGSTLTQQLVKNVFLSQDKKFIRKIKEMIISVYIESNYTKDQIINAYFNEVFWGLVGGVYIKGVDAASRVYFGKVPEELTSFESAILVGMLKGPHYYSPLKSLERLKERTGVVWGILKDKEFVDPTTYEWTESDWKLWQNRIIKLDQGQQLKSIFIVQRNKLVHPFEQMALYKSIKDLIKGRKEVFKDKDIAVKTLIISKNCPNGNCVDSFSFYTKLERDKIKAITEEFHQVGSILKPIIYHQFLDLGKTLGDEVGTAPITLNLKSGDWTPKEGSAITEEKITLLEAIQKSKNIPLIRTANELGFENLEEKLLDYIPKLKQPLGEYPAQLLGAVELSLVEIAESYLKFIDSTCKKIKAEEVDEDETILFHMTDAEKTTISRSSKEFFKDMKIFGKTGTTNNGLDNWFVAYDGNQISIIWFGVETGREGSSLPVAGSSTSFKIYQNFIQYRGIRPSEVICN